jgi:hypothetical protein
MRRAGLSLSIGFAVLSLARVAAAQTPPGTGTDMEIDPDAKPPEPPPPEEKKEPELPPADPNAWGVGGKEEEGKFAPAGKTGALKKDEDSVDNDPPNVLPPPGEFSVDMVVGFGDTLVNADVEPTKATVVSFIVGGQYRLGDVTTLGLRFPYTPISSLTTPTIPADINTFAVGNLEIAVRPSFAIGKRWRLPLGVAFYIPLASGDLLADDNGGFGQAIVNQAAAESRGWEENAIFASKRLGFTPSVGIAYDRGPVHASASTKLEIIKRSGGVDPEAEPPPRAPTAKLHDPNTNWVTGLSFFYDFLGGKVTPGLRLWMALSTPPSSVGTSDYSGAQFVLEPDVTGKIPLNPKGDMALTGGLGFILPLGGHVGGADGGSGMKGLRVKVALQF